MLDISWLTAYLQTLPTELVLVIMYITGVLSLGLFYRLLGRTGVCIFLTLGVIIANIQVLKAMNLWLFSEPVAMGTVVLMTTYLATDLLAEHYGRDTAKKAVWCGFVGILLVTIIMVLTLGIPQITDTPDATRFNMAHEAIYTLFSPAPGIFVASLSAFLISQYTDISIFLMVKKLTGTSSLWLRSFVSTGLSSLLDSVIFSVLAWKVFVPLQIDFTTLVFTYILGTYILRLLLTILNVPALYLLTKFRPPAATHSKPV